MCNNLILVTVHVSTDIQLFLYVTLLVHGLGAANNGYSYTAPVCEIEFRFQTPVHML